MIIEQTTYLTIDIICAMMKTQQIREVINMRSDKIKKGISAAPQRALLHALGVTEKEHGSSRNGIGWKWYNSCCLF